MANFRNRYHQCKIAFQENLNLLLFPDICFHVETGEKALGICYAKWALNSETEFQRDLPIQECPLTIFDESIVVEFMM